MQHPLIMIENLIFLRDKGRVFEKAQTSTCCRYFACGRSGCIISVWLRATALFSSNITPDTLYILQMSFYFFGPHKVDISSIS